MAEGEREGKREEEEEGEGEGEHGRIFYTRRVYVESNVYLSKFPTLLFLASPAPPSVFLAIDIDMTSILEDTQMEWIFRFYIRNQVPYTSQILDFSCKHPTTTQSPCPRPYLCSSSEQLSNCLIKVQLAFIYGNVMNGCNFHLLLLPSV